MLDNLARNWWALALRGVAAIVFGLATLLWPGITLWVLVLFFAAYMLVDGIFAIVTGLRAAQYHRRWWPLILEGVADFVAGAVALLWPRLALLGFIYVTAVWAILSGIALLIAALRLHRAYGEVTLILGGLVSIAWGILVVVWPIAGELALAWWIGAYALLFGVFMLTFALSLRRRPRAGL
jgi:uncharacterized membrane protein HdeD (DUF308 family)